MLSCFDFARQFDMTGVAARMILSVLCGGAIGLEREYKGRSAGFRTHILICMGAAVTILTSQYMVERGLFTDVTRMGAQVVAGIGFIGAGSIIVTWRQRVKGLTTAAGLWTSAVIGLACGAGYVEAALLATVLVLLSELLLTKLEHGLTGGAEEVTLYIEYSDNDVIENISRIVHEAHLNMSELEISRVDGKAGGGRYCAVTTLRVSRRTLEGELIKNISSLENVISVEEL